MEPVKKGDLVFLNKINYHYVDEPEYDGRPLDKYLFKLNESTSKENLSNMVSFIIENCNFAFMPKTKKNFLRPIDHWEKEQIFLLTDIKNVKTHKAPIKVYCLLMGTVKCFTLPHLLNVELIKV